MEREEHRVTEPVTRPPLEADVQRSVDGEARERLATEPLEALLPEPRALLRGDDLEPGRSRRHAGRGREGVGLLDLAVHLDEPEAVCELLGRFVVRARPDEGEAQGLDVIGQTAQQGRADAPSPVLRQHAGDHASRVGALRPLGQAVPEDGAALTREQQQPVGGVAGPELGQRLGALVGDDRDPDASPLLVVVVGDAGRDLHLLTVGRASSGYPRPVVEVVQ